MKSDPCAGLQVAFIDTKKLQLCPNPEHGRTMKLMYADNYEEETEEHVLECIEG